MSLTNTQKSSQFWFPNLVGWEIKMAKPFEEYEVQDRNVGEEEEDAEEEETSFMDADDDFYRFLVDGPREYHKTNLGSDSVPVFQARSEKQYKAKQEVLYKLFGETFDRRFGDKMTFFMNKTKPIVENIGPKKFITGLEYNGKKVAQYLDEKYVLTGDSQQFALDAQAAQEEFENTPMGRYCGYLRDQGLMDVSPNKLHELYDFDRTEESRVRFKRGQLFGGDDSVDIRTFGRPFSDMERLEIFKQRMRRAGIVGAFAVVLASTITAITVLTRKAGRSTTKAIASNEKEVVKAVKQVPIVASIAPVVRKTMQVAKHTTEVVSDNLWIVVIPLAILYLSSE